MGRCEELCATLSCAFAWSCMEEERMEKRVICRAGLSQAMLAWRMCLALLVRDFAGLVDFYISQQKADEVFIHLLCIDTVCFEVDGLCLLALSFLI